MSDQHATEADAYPEPRTETLEAMDTPAPEPTSEAEEPIPSDVSAPIAEPIADPGDESIDSSIAEPTADPGDEARHGLFVDRLEDQQPKAPEVDWVVGPADPMAALPAASHPPLSSPSAIGSPSPLAPPTRLGPPAPAAPQWIAGPAPGPIVIGVIGLVALVLALLVATGRSINWSLAGPGTVIGLGTVVIVLGVLGLRRNKA